MTSVEPLSEDEKRALKEVTFFLALNRAHVSHEIRGLLYRVQELCSRENGPEFAKLCEAVRQLQVPDASYDFAMALGIVPEDTEYVNGNDYDRLRSRFAGVPLQDGYAPEDLPQENPAELLGKLTKGL